MSIKDLLYTEKGKIGAAVMVAVLVTTAIIVPVSIFSDRALNNEKIVGGVSTYGYDDQISSTGEKANIYMEITKGLSQNVYGSAGDMVVSMEPTLLKNPLYNSMTDDNFILDGVYKNSNALGYLTLSQIINYGEEKSLVPLMVEDKETNEMISPVVEEGILGNVVEVPNSAYGEANEANLTSTLNTHLRVSVDVADTLRDYMLLDVNGATTSVWDGKNIDEDTAKILSKTEFVIWLYDEDLGDDFVMSFILFNYMIYDTSNHDDLQNGYLPGTQEDNIEMTGKNIDNFITNFDTMMNYIEGPSYSVEEQIENVLFSADDKMGYTIFIDGTGTNSGIMKQQFTNFNEDTDIQEASILKENEIVLVYNLMNGGSGQGWESSQNEIPDVTTGNTDDGRSSSFIGTQSRPGEDEEVGDWGYKSSTVINDKGIYIPIEDQGKRTPISFTTGIDLTSFFVNGDLTFQINLSYDDLYDKDGNNTYNDLDGKKVDGSKMIYSSEIIDIGSDEIKTYTVKPIGITDEGAKLIYENGASWESAFINGWLYIEIIN